jgi:limonene 1,2-monooxygenase
MNHRMRFGIFLAPFHKPGINPTLALEQDLKLIQWLDRCGYDEAWCGEHHSAGSEISASPEIFIAVASQAHRSFCRDFLVPCEEVQCMTPA